MTAPVELHVAVDEGSGDPLVLLHGWPQDSTMWRRALPGLRERFRCIALDLRGLGRSPAPPDGYEKPQLAEDVLHTLDGLGVERFRIMGHDWGGITAQLIAASAPERVERAVILDVPSLWSSSRDPRQLIGGLHMPILASPLGPRAAAPLGAQIMRLSGVPAEDVEHYRQMLSEPARARASSRYYRTFLTQDVRLLASPPPRPDVRMLFLGGSSSPITRWRRDVETIEGASHFVVDNRPEVVVERALAFL